MKTLSREQFLAHLRCADGDDYGPLVDHDAALRQQRDQLQRALVKLADAAETRKPGHDGYLSMCAAEARAAIKACT